MHSYFAEEEDTTHIKKRTPPTVRFAKQAGNALTAATLCSALGIGSGYTTPEFYYDPTTNPNSIIDSQPESPIESQLHVVFRASRDRFPIEIGNNNTIVSDSGCSGPLASNPALLHDYKPAYHNEFPPYHTADGDTIHVSGTGTLKLQINTTGGKEILLIPNTRYVQGSGVNLLSESHLVGLSWMSLPT